MHQHPARDVVVRAGRERVVELMDHGLRIDVVVLLRPALDQYAGGCAVRPWL